MPNYATCVYFSDESRLYRASALRTPTATILDDEAYGELQRTLLANPLAGDVIEGTGGLRKIRYRDSRRSKGKRGGLRVIYYWWLNDFQFWLFTVYDKDEVTDLTATEKKALKVLFESEVAARSK